jgi:hypothetical protein
MKIQIKHNITGKVLLEGDAESVRDLINKNSDKTLNLSSANLIGVDNFISLFIFINKFSLIFWTDI